MARQQMFVLLHPPPIFLVLHTHLILCVRINPLTSPQFSLLIQQHNTVTLTLCLSLHNHCTMHLPPRIKYDIDRWRNLWDRIGYRNTKMLSKKTQYRSR